MGRRRPAREPRRESRREPSLDRQEEKVLAEFQRAYGVTFHDPVLLKLALTHRSYLSVTGQGPRESNERLEFLGDSVLGLVTSEFLYRAHPDEHEGQLTKTKSLLVSKAILSRRALRMGLGRFVLMSHSEVESGGRQRLSILADAFESVLGAIYLDQGFEPARQFIHHHLLEDSDEIVADKRHTNYKSHLQEYVQSTYRTHPVYRIRSEYGPDHSKHFMVEVMVGRRNLGVGRGHNKKEAEQAAARDALENVKRLRDGGDAPRPAEAAPSSRGADDRSESSESGDSRRRRRRRGGRGRGDESREAFAGEAPQRPGAARPPAAGEETEQEDADEVDFDLDVIDAGASDARRVGAVEGRDDLAEDSEEVVDDLDDDDVEEEVDDDDDSEDDDSDDDDSDDDDADEDDDEDDDEEPEEHGVREIAPARDEPAPREVVRNAPPPRESRSQVRYGRSSRRGGRSPQPGPGAVQPEPGAATEALHVDPFGIDEPVPKARESDGPREQETHETAADEQRVAEIEQAMSNFGQRRPEGYGRRGRPARRGR